MAKVSALKCFSNAALEAWWRLRRREGKGEERGRREGGGERGEGREGERREEGRGERGERERGEGRG
jgi:hypothetical protein